MTDVRMLVFGSCNVRAPLFKAAKQWPRDPATNWDDVTTGLRIEGPFFFTFTVGEMLQSIDCYRGERQIPAHLHELCHMAPRWAPTPGNNPLDKVDVALAEPTTSVEIEFDGYHLNRGPVRHLLDDLAKANPLAKKLRFQWYTKGIVAMDDEVKRDVAAQLIPLIPEETPHRELTAEIFRGAVGRRRDIHEGIRLLARSLHVPLGVVAYTWRYMPDGRPLSWPDGFHAEVINAARALELPLYEPRPLINQLGMKFALKDDLAHYTHDFEAVVAKHLIEFGASVSHINGAAPLFEEKRLSTALE